MLSIIRKFSLVLGAMLIAAAITYYPWTYLDEFTGSASSVYGMSALLWAPCALFIGVGAGFAFAFALWPRRAKPRRPTPPAEADRGPSSFEA